MNAVRAAALSGTLGDLQVGTRTVEGEVVGHTLPGTDRFVGSCAPSKRGKEYIFAEAPTFDERGEDIGRYPHMGKDTETYMADAESEYGYSTQIDGEVVAMD